MGSGCGHGANIRHSPELGIVAKRMPRYLLVDPHLSGCGLDIVAHYDAQPDLGGASVLRFASRFERDRRRSRAVDLYVLLAQLGLR
jgi:hypothetical protein